MSTLLTLLKLLPLEMAELSDGDYIDPRQPVGRGEKVLGTLSDDEKKMYTLRVRTISTLKHLEADFDLTNGTNERFRVKTEIQRLVSRVEILDKLFWDMVNNDHNTWSVNIGVRKGFVIVEMNPSTGLGLLGRFVFGCDEGEEE